MIEMKLEDSNTSLRISHIKYLNLCKEILNVFHPILGDLYVLVQNNAHLMGKPQPNDDFQEVIENVIAIMVHNCPEPILDLVFVTGELDFNKSKITPILNEKEIKENINEDYKELFKKLYSLLEDAQNNNKTILVKEDD